MQLRNRVDALHEMSGCGPSGMRALTRTPVLGVLALAFGGALCCSAQARPVAPARGLILDGEGSSGGYTLFSPLLSTTTYLIDRKGRVVHTWQTDRAPGASQYLLDNGHLLRCAREANEPIFRAAGEGGRIQELTWDGARVWEYALASPQRVQHHDIEPLPNGNVLAIVWEHKGNPEAAGSRRSPP